MLSNTTSSPARRSRRRSVAVAAGLALGIVATAGISAAPASQAQASDAQPSYSLASYTIPTELGANVTAGWPDDITSDVSDALSAADDSIAAATTVTSDIAASGLDIGQPDTTIDTTELQAAVDRLSKADIVPALLMPPLTAKMTAQAAVINERVDLLRTSLNDAIAKKAAEEAAAEQARIEAEAAAAAAAQAAADEAARAKASSSSSSSSSGAPAPVVASGGSSGDNSPAGAQATARNMIGGYGWGDDQFGCLVSLWNKESGWNYQAYNRGSGATGIPQALPGSKMASAGGDWQTNAATQIAWGLGYIRGSYGTPCGAWSHSQSTGWY